MNFYHAHDCSNFEAHRHQCDGQTPSCSTCIAVYRTECGYDADSDHRRKGALKRDIQSLREQNDALDVIMDSLRNLPEDESISLLHNLRGDADLETVADALRANVQLPERFGQQTLEADLTQQRMSTVTSQLTLTPSPSSASREKLGDGIQPRGPGINTAGGRSTSWFRIPQDADFIEHLLDLYFCWIDPFYHFTSRDHFVYDMARGRTDYCSAMLVNAIAAFACHYSDRAAARTDANDPGSAGDQFFADAKQLLNQSDKPCLTTVQALGIMALRETSAGRDSNGYQLAGQCVRMALELGLHLSVMKSGTRPAASEVRRTTFWAVFNLET